MTGDELIIYTILLGCVYGLFYCIYIIYKANKIEKKDYEGFDFLKDKDIKSMTEEDISYEMKCLERFEEIFLRQGHRDIHEICLQRRIEYQKEYYDRFGAKLHRGYTVNLNGKKPKVPTTSSNVVINKTALKEKIASAIRRVDLGGVSRAHEYVDGSRRIADAVLAVLKNEKIIKK